MPLGREPFVANHPVEGGPALPVETSVVSQRLVRHGKLLRASSHQRDALAIAVGDASECQHQRATCADTAKHVRLSGTVPLYFFASTTVFLGVFAPLPKVSELADQVAQIGQDAVVDEFALRRIAADARKLMSTDAANAHAVLGRVAALQWDVDGLRRHYRSAISLGDPVLSRWDYSTALFLVGEVGESYEVARDAWQRAPDNLPLLDDLTASALHVAHFGEARVFCDRRRKLAPKVEPLLAGVISQLVKAVRQGGFSEEGAQRALRSADSVRSEARIRPNRMTIVPSQDEPGSFLFEYRVITSPAAAGDLNEALALRWAESPEAMANPGLKFLPVFIGTVTNGSYT